MAWFIKLTIIEQLTLIFPYFIYGLITFLVLTITTVLTRYFCRKRWEKYEEIRLPETVKQKLADRDKLIRSLRSHIDKQDETIERYSVAVRAANTMNHRVSEILQLPMINEMARKKRAG